MTPSSSDQVATFISRWPRASAAEVPLSVADLSAQFTRAKPENVAEILATLVALSRTHES